MELHNVPGEGTTTQRLQRAVGCVELWPGKVFARVHASINACNHAKAWLMAQSLTIRIQNFYSQCGESRVKAAVEPAGMDDLSDLTRVFVPIEFFPKDLKCIFVSSRVEMN